MPTAVRLLLVRHGESTWNAEGRWQGQADPPLSVQGRDQARAAAAALGAVDLVATSDLARARETAAVLAAAGGQEVVVETGLRERDAGAFSGLTRAEIHARFPGLLPDDPARPPGTGDDGLVPPPGWEPDDDLTARAWIGIGRLAHRLAARGGHRGVAVTHSGLIYAIEDSLGARGGRIANLEGRWVVRADGRWSAGPRHLLLDPDTDVVTRPSAL